MSVWFVYVVCPWHVLGSRVRIRAVGVVRRGTVFHVCFRGELLSFWGGKISTKIKLEIITKSTEHFRAPWARVVSILLIWFAPSILLHLA